MSHISAERYDKLVRMIYAAGLDQSKWAAFLAAFSAESGNARLALHSHDVTTNANLGFLSHNYSEEHRSSYQAYYAATSPWNSRVAAMPVGKALRSQQLLAPEVLKKTEFYNDWIRPQDDIGTGAGITLVKDRERFLRLSCNIRFRDIETVQDHLVWLLDSLGEHIRLAFDLSRKLARNQIGPQHEDILNRLQDAVFLLDRAGRLTLLNTAAASMQRNGSCLSADRAGQISFKTNAAQLAYEKALAATLHGSGRAQDFLVQDGSRLGLRASLSPFVTADQLADRPFAMLMDGLPAAILIIAPSGDVSGHALARFARSHGLTPAEAALAQHLLEAGSVRSFAEARRVSIHTARNQLRSVLSKTGVTRQAALVALMAQTSRDTNPAENLARMRG
jgi:DNA-binding CsgD family transcriptional regulator